MPPTITINISGGTAEQTFSRVYDIIQDRYYKHGDTIQISEGQSEVKLAAALPFQYTVGLWKVNNWSSRESIFTFPLPSEGSYTLELFLTPAVISEGTLAPILVSSSPYVKVPYTQIQPFIQEFSTSYNIFSEPAQKFSLAFVLTYTAGAQIISIYNYQNVKIAEEEWTRVYASPRTDGTHPAYNYLKDALVRHFFIYQNTAYFLALTNEYPYKLRLLSLDLSTQDWDIVGEFTLSSPQRDLDNKIFGEFGSVAVGHGGIVFATTNDAFYFPLGNTGEPLRIPFISSFYNLDRRRWGARCVLTVPEGFVFLPHAILWDMDTFWDFPTNIQVSESDRLVPVYFEGIAGVVVRNGEYGTQGGSGEIKDFYIWGGMDKGFVKGKVRVEEGVADKPYAFYLGGSLLKNTHYAFNAATPLDEATLLAYTIEKDPQNPTDMSKWTLTLSWSQLVLPLPFNLPSSLWKPPAWGELWSFATTQNGYFLYFPRVWDRIYRFDVDAKELSLAHRVPYLDFSGNSILRPSEEEEAQMLLYFHEDEGRVYIAHLRSGGRVQIWRQSVSVVPPPAPNITFPTEGLQVPRKFEVIFQPFPYNRPQEFAVSFRVTTTHGYQNFYYVSYLHRSFFQVSWDGGNTWEDMTGPITIQEGDNVRVKFNLPIYLPYSSTVVVTVYAIAA